MCHEDIVARVVILCNERPIRLLRKASMCSERWMCAMEGEYLLWEANLWRKRRICAVEDKYV